VIHDRPAVMQELSWRPTFAQKYSPQADAVESLLFSFYNGELSRIVVSYDSQKTKGLTTQDMVDAISVNYGTPVTIPGNTEISPSQVYNSHQTVIARWEDTQNAITLFQSSSFRPTFGLVAVSKRLDGLATAAAAEADRLDEEEAPQREIERRNKQDADDEAAQRDARAINKSIFRP
jgi:hypothetical protein